MEEQNRPIEQNLNIVKVADILVQSSSTDILTLTSLALGLLANENVKRYLNMADIKKRGASYCE